MNSKHIRADVSFAWPSAEIAVMGAEGAVNIIHRREIGSAEDAETKRSELIEDYSSKFSNPFIAAERGYVDDVIEPQETRRKLVQSLEMLRSKRETIPQRKHGNIPL
jgi:acetyl-CoA carboxylase carboxyltransferase component